MPSRHIGPVCRNLTKAAASLSTHPFILNDKLSPHFKKLLQSLYLNLGKLLAYYDALPKEDKNVDTGTD